MTFYFCSQIICKSIFKDDFVNTSRHRSKDKAAACMGTQRSASDLEKLNSSCQQYASISAISISLYWENVSPWFQLAVVYEQLRFIHVCTM